MREFTLRGGGPHSSSFILKGKDLLEDNEEVKVRELPFALEGMHPGSGYFMTYRRMVKPEDLNPANRLFGGRIMEWVDEAVAMYAMCQMNTKHLVTKKVSELLFCKPVFQGDVLQFWVKNKEIGSSSLTIDCKVKRKVIGEQIPSDEVLTCELVFVAIDPKTGKSTPHGMKK